MRTLTLISLLFFAITKIVAQNYLISFTGTGLSSIVDSVKFQNITQGTSFTLAGNDTLHLTGADGLNDYGINEEAIKIHPNPMQAITKLSFYAKHAGNTKIVIYDISGKKVLQISNNLSQGINSCNLSGLIQGVYFISITGDKYIYTSKIISLNYSHDISKLEFCENVNTDITINKFKSIKAIVNTAFTTGDSLRFTGYSGIYTASVIDIPTSNKTITFNFAEPIIAIGSTYQGGTVSYIFQPGDIGYIAGEVHGLIAAPIFKSTPLIWGCYDLAITGARGTSIGTGSQNTLDILAACTVVDIAARLCSDLVVGVYNDWYLPSIGELNILYINRDSIGGFSGNSYWSSTNSGPCCATGIDFSTGSDYSFYRLDAYYVRAVRSF